LNACISHEVIPTFCRICDKSSNQTQITPSEKNTLEKRKLNNELELQTQKLLAYKNTYIFQKNIISKNSSSPTHFSGLINDIENSVKRSENKFNITRDRKFVNLISKKNPYYTKTELINLTDISVPDEILSKLELGPNNPIGDYVRNEGSETYLGLDSLFYKIKSEARKNGITEICIEHLRCNITLTGQKLSNCNTKDARIEEFLKFKNENPELIFFKV
jgi:hypothetical protein